MPSHTRGTGAINIMYSTCRALVLWCLKYWWAPEGSLFCQLCDTRMSCISGSQKWQSFNSVSPHWQAFNIYHHGRRRERSTLIACWQLRLLLCFEARRWIWMSKVVLRLMLLHKECSIDPAGPVFRLFVKIVVAAAKKGHRRRFLGLSECVSALTARETQIWLSIRKRACQAVPAMTKRISNRFFLANQSGKNVALLNPLLFQIRVCPVISVCWHVPVDFPEKILTAQRFWWAAGTKS